MIGFFREWLAARAQYKVDLERFQKFEKLVEYLRKFCEDGRRDCEFTSNRFAVKHYTWFKGALKIEFREFLDSDFSKVEVFLGEEHNQVMEYTFHGIGWTKIDRWSVDANLTMELLIMHMLSGDTYQLTEYEKWKYEIE